MRTWNPSAQGIVLGRRPQETPSTAPHTKGGDNPEAPCVSMGRTQRNPRLTAGASSVIAPSMWGGAFVPQIHAVSSIPVAGEPMGVAEGLCLEGG